MLFLKQKVKFCSLVSMHLRVFQVYLYHVALQVSNSWKPVRCRIVYTSWYDQQFLVYYFMTTQLSRLDYTKILLLAVTFQVFKALIKKSYIRRKLLNINNTDIKKIFFTRNGGELISKFELILENNKYPVTNKDYEQLLAMIRDGYSFSRYGDGEYSMLQSKPNKPVYFDTATPFAKKRLQEVLERPVDKHLIGLIEGSVVVNQLSFTNVLSIFSRIKTTGLRPRMPILAEYSAEMLRLYSCSGRSDAHIFETGLFRNTVYERHLYLWKERDILYVTGSAKTCEKYGLTISEQFKTANSVEVIETVLENALSNEYDNILDTILSHPNLQGKMIVLSQGMAGTVLAYDLAKLGYQAIDFGQPFVNYPKRINCVESSL